MRRADLAWRALAVAVAAIVAPVVALRRPPPPAPRPPEALAIAAPVAVVPSGPRLFDDPDDPAAGAVAGATGAPPAPIGIVGRLPDAAQAIVRLGDGSVRTLAVGDSAGGWRLAGIEADRLHLRRGPEERTLVLPIRDAPPPSPAGSPLAPPPQ